MRTTHLPVAAARRAALAALPLLAACGTAGSAPPAPEVQTLAAAGATNPTIAAAPGTDRYFVVWVGRPGDGGEANVFLAASDDGGGFSAPVRVNDLGGDAAPHEQAPAQVAVGPEGHVHVLWQNSTHVPGRRFPASDLRLATSTDGGRTFSSAITVNDDAGGLPSSHTFHDLVVAGDGTLHVSWIDSRVRDRARAAAPPGAEDAESGIPGSEIRVARSTDGGRSFGASSVVDSGACPCCRTALALGPDGSLYVAWRKELAGGVRDVVVARSRPGEAGFGPPVRVHPDGWVFPACPHAGPSLAVDGAGRLHVAWYTGREGRQGLWHAVSDDGAASFGPPAAVLTDAWVPPSQVRLVAGPGDGVRVAWEDRRGEERSIRLGRIEGSGPPRPSDALPLPGVLPAAAAGAGSWAAAWLDGDSVRVRTLPDPDRWVRRER